MESVNEEKNQTPDLSVAVVESSSPASIEPADPPTNSNSESKTIVRPDSPPATINIAEEESVPNSSTSTSNTKPPQMSPSSGSSTSSTPVSSPFKPHFTILSVKIAGQKDALNPSPEFTTYLIESKRNSNVNGTNSDYGDDSSKIFLVKRQWEDVEYLDHCLASTAFPSDGLIIPPLPPKLIPTFDDSIDGSYDHMLKTLSSSRYAESIINPRWIKDCDEIFEYLGLMSSHPVFGKNFDTWSRFLTADKPVPRVRRKKESASIMSKISDTFSTSGGNSSSISASNISSGNVAIAESALSSPSSFSRTLLLSHRDCEEYFQREKEWVHAYNIYTKDALEAFNSVVQAKESK